MTIGEKLTTIAKNEQKVLAEGQRRGNKAQKIFFSTKYQVGGQRNRYDYAFACSYPDGQSRGWNDNTFCPYYNLNVSTANYMFYRAGITDLKGILEKNGVKLNFSNCSSATSLFFQSSVTNLGVLDFGRMSSLSGTLYYASELKNIDKIIIKEDCTFSNSPFMGMQSLETVVFEGCISKNNFNISSSPKLTVDSILSILNCLKDYSADTSGTQWKVTIGATNVAKLTTEQLEIAENKGWMVA